MRDRLIELLRQIEFDYYEECVCAFEDGYKGAPDFAKFFVDRLLDNGVIAPPCRVGQTVYRVMCRGMRDFFIREETVWIVDMHATAGLEIITKSVEGKGLTYFPKICIENLGKTVFLTREEAEKALAERSKG